MSALVKTAFVMALGTVLAVFAWAVVRKILVGRGSLPDVQAGPVAKLVLFAFFFCFVLSVVPIALHFFTASQGRIGNSGLETIRFLREHEMGVTFSVWTLITVGILIALPAMWTPFFGFGVSSPPTR